MLEASEGLPHGKPFKGLRFPTLFEWPLMHNGFSPDSHTMATAFLPVLAGGRDPDWPVERARHLAERLQKLFNRQLEGFWERDGWVKLGPTLRLISFAQIRFSLVRPPYSACAAALKGTCFDTRAESGTHVRMKAAALNWMIGEGARDAACEVNFVAGRSDVCSVASNWIVECGHTRMGKLRGAVAALPRGRFTLLPYQDLRRFDRSPRRLLAVDFTWAEDAHAEARPHPDYDEV